MFTHARLRLTAWYLVTIMLVSVLFSIAFYNLASREVRRFTRIQEFRTQIIFPSPNRNFLYRIRPEDVEESEQRLKIILILINAGIFIFAGGAAYFLAGKTLKPIQKMVDEQNRFITDSSHELRTPLTSLRSEIEVALRNKSLTLAEAKKLLESNLEETINLQVLSDHLLELAQSGSLIRREDIVELSLDEVVSSAIKKIGSQAKEKQIKIENRIGDSKVLGVADRLTESFIILLDNAIKYSPKKSKVVLSSEIQKDSIRIMVVDQGIGISKEDLPRIFSRFYRADQSRSQTQGYGLGLSIAQKIIEAHKGEIFATSVPGKGATFILELPIVS